MIEFIHFSTYIEQLEDTKGNHQKPYMEGQTLQWPNEKDKQWPTKYHTEH